MPENDTVLAMIILRLFIAVISFITAGLMYFFGTVAFALRINSLIGLINYLTLTTICMLGITCMSKTIPFGKLIAMLAGFFLILWGTMK